MDHRKFLKLFLESEAILRAFLLAATCNPTEAEDLLQEISALLWERFGEYDDQRSFRAWAMGFARMEVLKWRQRIARSRLILSEEAVKALADSAGEMAPEPDPRHLELTQCVGRLDEPVKELLRLRYVECLSVARIAELTGKTIGAIEMALVRTRRALRDCVSRKVLEAGELE